MKKNSQKQKQGLQNEIAMIRNVLHQIIDQTDTGCSVQELLRILDAIGKASTRLATLLKTEHVLGEGEGVTDLLNQALREMMKEQGGE
ncbi:MAG: hypothetical protein JEZ06_02725 [Anaerolineaceae bacterium]|nr:hypothetical protein [Anaerolineaceae bacterium]